LANLQQHYKSVMSRVGLTFALVLTFCHLAATLPAPLIRSAVASNTTSRCTSRDVRLHMRLSL
jgi:hypothetical protein